MESEHFDNYFVKKKKEKVSSGKKFGAFSARYSNYTFNRKFNSKISIFKKVQSHEVFYKKRCSQKLLKIHRKTPLETQSLFFKKSTCIYNFSLTKEIPTQVFSCQLSKMFKTIFFSETLWTTTSELFK